MVNDNEIAAPQPAFNVDELLAKCHDLLNELEDFQKFLVEQKKEQVVEIRQFRNSVASEIKSLERLSAADPTAERTIHTLRSSNLPFYNAVWTAAKASKGVVLFNKRFYWEQPVKDRGALHGTTKPKKRSALVDIVAEDGEEWIKVSTITETRLLFEKAKVGWEGADSDDDTEGELEDGGKVLANGANPISANAWRDDDDDDDRVELLKTAEDLQKAARKVHIRYKHPRIRFVLPKITQGHSDAIDAIIASIRATGATVQCGSLSLPPSPTPQSTNGTSHPSPFLWAYLLPDPLAYLTPTLNIDCTILLALVSDLSHSTLSPSPTFHRAIRRQIDLEAEEKLLPSSLYPAMANRELVCTATAAKRMREIVTQIGTDGEKLRTELLLGEGDAGMGKSPQELRNAFQELSEYDVPPGWRLPIRVEAGDYDLARLPAVAKKVVEELTEINRSVFLWGWERGYTTVSSNRTVAKVVEGVVEAGQGEGEEVVGPGVWLCATARSLVGKEKGRRE
ncbi:hypothetical protein MMC30_004953 [Trapelia coarctata]|nr:hypothetical protein [Trapelia coarctata]